MRPTPEELSKTVDKVVELRVQGYSAAYISKTLSISVTRVDKILDMEFRRRFENREEMKRTVALRYEYLIRPLMERYIEAGKAVDRKDAEVLATLLREQRRLFALDDPVKLEVKHIEELSDEDLYRELQMHTEVKQLPSPNGANPTLPTKLTEAEVIDEQ